MRKHRKLESPKEREERLKREAQRKIDQAEAEEAASDERIRKNIELYGP